MAAHYVVLRPNINRKNLARFAMLAAMAASTHYDTVIIGAGMSGLAAGIRLAYYEKKVCVLDRHTMPGGLNSFYRLGRRDFDVGLHAMTNYAPRTVRHAPLNKLLRQLRLDYDELALCPQRESSVKFPGVTLRFSNDFALFASEVGEKFPKQADGFARLVQHIQAYNDVDLNAQPASARTVLIDFITDPLLTDMILCPLMYYGSADVGDMDFSQFVIMFKSIFCEGFSRPRVGVRQVIGTLLKKYKACRGELRMGAGIKRLEVRGDNVTAIELDDGSQLTADTVLSSAGFVETMRLCSDAVNAETTSGAPEPGRMTFMESIAVLDREPASYGHTETIVFFNNSERFDYRPAAELADPRSGVICCPNNFQYEQALPEGIVRVTNIANYGRWRALSEDDYVARKRDWYDRSVAEAVKFVPDFRKFVTFIDTFTPRTIEKFTGHINGAVYGSPRKLRDGRTRVKNLFLCGTDQGFLGNIGAMLSGISMANLHVLQRSGRS
jgi:phytoene dehydrogenase-like protein